MTRLFYTYVDGPVGNFLVAGTDTTLHFTGFTSGHQQRAPQADWVHDDAPLRYAVDPLRAYFAGEPVEFDLPLHTVGTEFQRSVWRALRQVGHGETASYGDIARRIGKPAASRAVGAANAANHIPIIIPCHRIIGADGSLTGFGGGLDAKTQLLQLEGAARPDAQLGLFAP